MNKRKFLSQAALIFTGASIVPSMLLSACKTESKKEKNMKTTAITETAFELPKIPYGYNAFPDTIDARTMEIHHTKHHQGYTDKLNAALKEENISGKSIEEILGMENLSTAIRNNGGGYYNHSLYWEILTPGGTMSDSFKNKITEDFGSEEAFLNELSQAALNRFGSGWGWVIQDDNRKLHIFSTPNQDNPLMKVSGIQGVPILGIDVWEHAYYLKYQNKRGEYLKNILKIINWEKVEDRLI